MDKIIVILSTVIAIEHLMFLYIEMFLWTKKSGRRIFGHSMEEAEKTKILAANQGLYNGFLAAGLFWGVVYPDPVVGHDILLFFLICILLAGSYAGITSKKNILYIQALPALVTIVFIVI